MASTAVESPRAGVQAAMSASPRTETSTRSRAAVTDRLQSLKLDKDTDGKRFQRTAPRRSRWRMWTVLFLMGTAVLLGLGYSGMLGSRVSEYLSQAKAKVSGQTSPSAAGVEVDAVQFQVGSTMENLLDTSGRVRPKTSHNISPRMPGVVIELLKTEGQTVEKGDELAKLDATPFQLDLDQAQGALEVAKANLAEMEKGARPQEIDQLRAMLEKAKLLRDNAQHEFDRIEKLGTFATDSERDSARTRLADTEKSVTDRKLALDLIEEGARKEARAAARAKVNQAQAAVDDAAWFVDNCTVRSPVSGTVLQVNAQIGETVRPDSVGGVNGLSTSLCVIADCSTMIAEVDIQERDLHKVQIGNPCRISTEAYPDLKYDGLVDKVMPSVNSQRGIVLVRVKIPHPDKFMWPNMNCRVVFLKPSLPGGEVPKIPERAVLQEGNDTVVFVAEEGVARRRKVTVGEAAVAEGSNKRVVEVRSGLREGDTVLLPGDQPLSEGQAVQIRQTATE